MNQTIIKQLTDELLLKSISVCGELMKVYEEYYGGVSGAVKHEEYNIIVNVALDLCEEGCNRFDDNN